MVFDDVYGLSKRSLANGTKRTTTDYRQVVYKSRGLCAIVHLFGAASIQVRLLFEGGLYAIF